MLLVIEFIQIKLKIKEQKKRKLEVEVKENAFWLNGLYDSYFYGTNPRLILEREKQINSLTSKMIQDVAKKYINVNNYIRVALKPEKPGEKTLKPF